MVLGEHFRPVIRHIILNGDDAVKDVLGFQHGHRMPHCDECARLLIEIQDCVHHEELFLHGYTGIILVKCILLQETETDHTGDLKNQFLVVREYVASDQLYDFQQAALLI